MKRALLVLSMSVLAANAVLLTNDWRARCKSASENNKVPVPVPGSTNTIVTSTQDDCCEAACSYVNYMVCEPQSWAWLLCWHDCMRY